MERPLVPGHFQGTCRDHRNELGARDTLNRQLRSAVTNQALADLVMALYEEDRLCIVHEEPESHEPRIICSMGLVKGD